MRETEQKEQLQSEIHNLIDSLEDMKALINIYSFVKGYYMRRKIK